jgi:hypothetical protein
MKRHVIEFEIEVPDKESKKKILENLEALLELLNYKSDHLQIDPIVRAKGNPFPPYPIDYPLPRPVSPWIKRTEDMPQQWKYEMNKSYTDKLKEKEGIDFRDL